MPVGKAFGEAGTDDLALAFDLAEPAIGDPCGEINERRIHLATPLGSKKSGVAEKELLGVEEFDLVRGTADVAFDGDTAGGEAASISSSAASGTPASAKSRRPAKPRAKSDNSQQSRPAPEPAVARNRRSSPKAA